MVTSSHEAMHRIFQEDPGIFTRTFKKLRITFPDPVAVSMLPTDVTETRAVERRIDTLLRMDTADGGGYLLAVEAQGRKDPEKHGSWAYYLAHLYAKYALPPVLLVVCQDENTARWAKGPIRIGLPEWPCLTVRPLVLGPHNIPLIKDASIAAEDVPLATLSAITHGKSPNAPAILEALATALKTIDKETAEIFAELTEQGLGKTPAAKIWKDLKMAIPTSFFRSETSMLLRAEGRSEGRAEGRAEDILLILDARGIDTPQDARDRITGCTDLDTLGRWLRHAVTATTLDEVFAD
ncbi:hypothetical protein [Streptomyces sp. TRM49041]|uniref:hypothetical protein n=1 Tax=Streptomyces sp. TRM49041 TaxID=2603216 RepID=UPI0011EC0531|nr:hypothetical protein [Streptomyces sp. TRM49041]